MLCRVTIQSAILLLGIYLPLFGFKALSDLKWQWSISCQGLVWLTPCHKAESKMKTSKQRTYLQKRDWAVLGVPSGGNCLDVQKGPWAIGSWDNPGHPRKWRESSERKQGVNFKGEIWLIIRKTTNLAVSSSSPECSRRGWKISWWWGVRLNGSQWLVFSKPHSEFETLSARQWRQYSWLTSFPGAIWPIVPGS